MNANQDGGDGNDLDDNTGQPAPKEQVTPASGGHEHASDNKPKAEPPTPPDWAKRREIIGLVFDGIVTVATAVGVLFLILQWDQTESALSEAKESNRLTRIAQAKADADSIEADKRQDRLIAANETTANAAKDSAQAAKDSAAASIASSRALDTGNELSARSIEQEALAFKNDQRARVSITLNLVPAEPKTANELFHWQIRPTNDGKTEALKTRSVSYAYVAAKPEPAPAWASIAAIEGTPLSTRQTGREFGTQSFKFNDPNGLDLYLKDRVRLYLWNRVYYCDTSQRLHWVQTCAFHTYGTPLTQVGYCTSGNTTDTNNGDAISPECK
jgi:hypothetical protein